MRDPQSQARAVDFFRGVEGFEDMPLNFRRHAVSRVRNSKANPRAATLPLRGIAAAKE